MTLLLLVACVQSDLDSGVGSLNCSQDCARPECVDDAACEAIPPPDEDCTDGIDNDGDGAVDCRDDDCTGRPECKELCDDGVDNDQDGLTDCADAQCLGVPECLEDCFDGVDNDVDGWTDCADPECVLDCMERSCTDQQDNDRDGWVDCEDPDCRDTPDCAEDCSDGADNNGDGRTDCQDTYHCREEPHCQEACSDGVDNDWDGLLDCEDADCQFECSEHSCTDGLDNNGNGRVDCEDEACWGLKDCPEALGLRVLQGQGLVFSSSSSLASSRSGTCRSASGTLHLGLEGANVSCFWTADRLAISQHALSYTNPSGILELNRSYAKMSFSAFQTTGACAPWLPEGSLGFDSSLDRLTSGRTELSHSVQLSLYVPGPYDHYAGLLLDGATLLGGPVIQRHASYSSFQIDPTLTEPWIFGP